MTQTRAKMRSALRPTGHPHPLLTADAVSQAMKTAVPAQYNPEIAEAIAADMTAQLTAAQRGPEWIATYDCTPWCVMDHAGADGTPGRHQGRTVSVTAPTSTFGTPTGSGPESTVLAARINQTTDQADAFGLETKVWLDVDTEVLELNVTQFRTLIAGLRRVLPDLEAMADQAEQLATGDHPGDPELKAKVMAELDAHIKAHDEGRFCGCVRCVCAEGRA